MSFPGTRLSIGSGADTAGAGTAAVFDGASIGAQFQTGADWPAGLWGVFGIKSARASSVAAPTSVTVGGFALTKVTGGDLTFTLSNISLWYGVPTALIPSGSNLVVTFGTDMQHCIWTGNGFTTTVTSGTNGLDAFLDQGSGALVKTNSGTGTSGTTVTLLAGDADHACFYILGKENAGNTTPGTNYTELHDPNVGGPNGSIQSCWRAGTDDLTAGDSSWTGSVAWGLIAITIVHNPSTHAAIVSPVSSTSVEFQTRTARARSASGVQIKYGTASDLTGATTSAAATTAAGSDFTAKRVVSGLTADTVYFYDVLVDSISCLKGTSATTPGTFRTPPAATHQGAVKIALMECLNTAGTPTDIMRGYQAMANVSPHFVWLGGDLYYPAAPANITEQRTNWKNSRSDTRHGVTAATLVLTKFCCDHIWDDHDYVGNDSDVTSAPYVGARADAIQVFNEAWPVSMRTGSEARDRTLRYGCIDFFFIDGRTCSSPHTDVEGAGKSMLADSRASDTGQKTRLKNWIAASTATWKVIWTSRVWNPTAKLGPGDCWGKFTTERAELVSYIRGLGLTGVVVLSGDIHSGGTWDSGTTSSFPEFSLPHFGQPASNVDSGVASPGPHQAGNGTWSHPGTLHGQDEFGYVGGGDNSADGTLAPTGFNAVTGSFVLVTASPSSFQVQWIDSATGIIRNAVTLAAAGAGGGGARVASARGRRRSLLGIGGRWGA